MYKGKPVRIFGQRLKMGGNMTHMTHKWPHVPTWPRAPGAQRWRKCWHCWLSVFTRQHSQHGDGLRPASVGIANNANIYWLLAAGCWLRARWPEGWGEGPWPEGQRERRLHEQIFSEKYFFCYTD